MAKTDGSDQKKIRAPSRKRSVRSDTPAALSDEGLAQTRKVNSPTPVSTDTVKNALVEQEDLFIASAIETDFRSASELIRTTSMTIARSTSVHFDNLMQTDKDNYSFFYYLTRIIAFVVDFIVFTFYAEGISLSGKAFHACEEDFFEYIINHLPENLTKQVHVGVTDGQAKMNDLLRHLFDDVAENSWLCIICSTMVLTTLVFFIIAQQGQTVGMILTGLSHTRDGKHPLNAFETFGRWLIGIACLPLCFIVNDGRTMADLLFNSRVVRTSTLTSRPSEKEETQIILEQTREVSEASHLIPRMSDKVNASWVSRPWNDLFFLAFLGASSLAFYKVANQISSPGGFAQSFAKNSVLYTLFGNAPAFIKNNTGSTFYLVIFSFLMFCVAALLFKFFAVFVFYLITFSVAIGLSIQIYLCIQISSTVMAVAFSVVLLFYIIMIYNRFDHLLMTVIVWKEGVSTIIRHPLVGMVVPLLECAFQVYQIWLFSVFITGPWTAKAVNLFGLKFTLETKVFYAWWSFQQLIVLFTVRNVFEIATAGTVSKYYFRQKDDSDFFGIARTFSSYSVACTKSLGSAVYGALVLYIAEFFKKTHGFFDNIDGNLPWFPCLPVKLVLKLIKFALASIYNFLQHLNGYCCTYIGMYGCSFSEAAYKSVILFGNSFASTLFLGDYSNLLFSIIMNALFIMTRYSINHVIVALNINNSDTYSCVIIVMYMYASFLWALQGAARAIMVCVSEEVSAGISPEELSCSDELKAAVKNVVRTSTLTSRPSEKEQTREVPKASQLWYGLGLVFEWLSIGFAIYLFFF